MGQAEEKIELLIGSKFIDICPEIEKPEEKDDTAPPPNKRIKTSLVSNSFSLITSGTGNHRAIQFSHATNQYFL